jgi:hypothetical protein
MIVCWIKICAVSLGGGVDVGRVAPEGVVSGFGDVGGGATVKGAVPMQSTIATRLVKHRLRHRMMYHW